ncbi:MAG: tRNA (adenosine(37)-N6)-threonylcarbamoyltransferase complex dimerization subunit type 1 TsaB [SAR202 cluster bacterium]|jgi:tRNA threonylcarbamoyladenosine biosynthesis protein TsaB|nr:tRNA (adenosine(37)-N6)-threonylcarbamoyltransferase complex dimerization subunit type 1 TsaB [SAR202 cluster bacterium]MDP6513071.1 tRNA (adenosine(37)-N6)-threonylcarbamoyltransferase complex dimerization subunit type 1 TsaB [SAR202 cluster bacterium]
MVDQQIALAIDTSTRHAVVGISKDGQSIAEMSWRSERNHSVELVPAIQRTLTQAHMELADIAAIYVAAGPGAFSALRVGMSTAMAIAMARGIPVVTMGALEIEVYPYLAIGQDVTALIGAGRTRLYVGRFKSVEPLSSGDVFLADRAEFLEDLPDDTIFCGEAASELRAELTDRLGEACKIIGDPPPTRSASVMAEIGHARLAAGGATSLSEIEPLYLRSSQVASAARRWPSPPSG